MQFNLLTLFPEAVEPYLKVSLIGRAQVKKILSVTLWNIRDFTTDKHKTVDDVPYGGGAGMVMKIEPIDRTLKALKTAGKKSTPPSLPSIDTTVVLSARGQPFTQEKAVEYAKLSTLTLIAGRYEGIDQRVADHLADEEISIGPYVLAGGELPALVIIEAVARLIPGVLGNEESLKEESFVSPLYEGGVPAEAGGVVEYPHYSKPADYKGWKVPEVLLSGNHEEIKKWREWQRKKSV